MFLLVLIYKYLYIETVDLMIVNCTLWDLRTAIISLIANSVVLPPPTCSVSPCSPPSGAPSGSSAGSSAPGSLSPPPRSGSPPPAGRRRHGGHGPHCPGGWSAPPCSPGQRWTEGWWSFTILFCVIAVLPGDSGTKVCRSVIFDSYNANHLCAHKYLRQKLSSVDLKTVTKNIFIFFLFCPFSM